MDSNKIRSLHLINALHQIESTTQRELSQQLNLSLGLVNAILKKLVKKGYFKAKTIPRNRMKYILTPKGMAEKSKLTYEYLQYSIGFYKSTRDIINELIDNLINKGIQSVALFGVGEIAEISYICLKQSALKLSTIVDPHQIGNLFMGLMVISPQNLHKERYDVILITELFEWKSLEALSIDLNIPIKKCVMVR